MSIKKTTKDITLYYTHRTRALRPRWLLEELGLPYRLELIDIFGGKAKTSEYCKIHPHGAVPAMVIDGRVMIESCAICHWLTDLYPEKGLAPALSSDERMEYEQWVFYVPGTLEPPAFQIISHSVILPEKHRVQAIVPWEMQRYKSVLNVLDRLLATREYMTGPRFTTADILVGSTLLWLPDLLNDHQSLRAYVERLKQRSAYQRASTKPSHTLAEMPG